MITWLLKPGELTLKGGNRKNFESVLKRNFLRMVEGTSARFVMQNGRFFVHANENDSEKVEQALDHLIGIAGWARPATCSKDMDDIICTCIAEAKVIADKGVLSFKIEARRTDKSFSLDSYGLRSTCGQAILDAEPRLKVDVQNPQAVITIEIREQAYIYSNSRKGLGGLPVGSAGRGLLLLSGGIDSPVAGFRMATRGMGIDAVHFHSYPYTSQEARQKVETLANMLSAYCMRINLYVAGFTKIQMRIKERATQDSRSDQPWSTVLLRMAMMECAEKIAQRTKCKCLITGESLSQVASQTVENLSCAESRIKIPVLRPLIGSDKQMIISTARKIGTYETSILPYEDCCVLFSPPHPVLQGDIGEAQRLYEALELDDLMAEVLETLEVVKFPIQAEQNNR